MKKFIDLFKEKNNKIFTKVFLSYIIILLLPVVINIIMVTILTGTVRSEISDSSFLLTENLRVAADQILENVLKISRQINMNGSMTAMYEYDSCENIYNLKESIDFLNSITFNTDDISNIFVYNPHADIAISDDGRGNAESFFEKYYSGTEYSCEKLTQEISAVTDGGFREVMSAEGDKVKYVEYRMPLMGTEIENVETLKGFPAFLIVRINQNLLDMSDAAKESYPAMQVFTLTGNERIIGTQPDFDIETGRLKSKTEDGGFKILKEKGIIYLCEKSSLTDWTYVTATSMLRYYREYFFAI